jgi:predicted RNase H-like HicB family nuclease
MPRKLRRLKADYRRLGFKEDERGGKGSHSKRYPRRNKEANMDEHINAANFPDPEWEKVRRYAMVIEWSDKDQLFLVSIPDFPGAHTHGHTRAEAAAMGEVVIALLLDGEVEPPPPRFTAMSYPVRPEAEVGEFIITAGNLR